METLFNTFWVSVLGKEDAANYIWLLWNTSTSIFSGSNPFFTNLLFSPFGASLTFDAPILNTIISLPIFLCCGAIASYNFLIILSFLGTFIGFCLFLNLLTESKKASIIGASLITFSSYRLTALTLGQLDLLSTQWIGFFLYFFFKTFSERFKKTDLLGLVLMFVFQAYTDYRTFIIVGLLLIGLVIFRTIRIEKYIKRFSFFLTFSLVLLLPMIFIHGKALLSYPQEVSLEMSPVSWSADLAGYFVPFSEKLDFISGFQNLRKTYFSLSIPFLGVISIIFLPIYLFLNKKSLVEKEKLKPWILVAAFFGILSLGQGLNILGKTVLLSDFMPYAILNNLPVFSFFHVPVRLSLGVVVSTTVIVSFALVKLFNRISNKKVSAVVFISLFIISIIQNIPFIDKLENIKSKNDSLLKNLSLMESGTLLYIPFGYMDSFHQTPRTYEPSSLITQMVHKKLMIGGYLSYVKPAVFNDYKSDVFIEKIVNCQEAELCVPLTKGESIEAIQKYNLKYILIDRQYEDSAVVRIMEQSFYGSKKEVTDKYRLLIITQ